VRDFSESERPEGKGTFGTFHYFIKIQAGDRRHPETIPYRCCLSALAGFGTFRRAGPARIDVSILEEGMAVNLERREKPPITEAGRGSCKKR